MQPILDFASIVSWYAIQISKIFVNLNSHFVGQCCLFLMGFGCLVSLFLALWKRDRE